MAADNFGTEFFRTQGWWRDETLRDWVAGRVASAPDHPAVLAATSRLSYAEMWRRVQVCAAGLRHLGLRRGDAVAVHLPNIPEFLTAWLAINEIGAVMQTAHTPYGPRELAHLLNRGEAKACFALAKNRDRSPASDLVALRQEVPSLGHVISVGGAVDGAEPFTSLLDAGAREPMEAQTIAGTDPFVLLFTSGTTSSPKAVAVTYNHFLSNARMCAQEFGITRHDRILCLAPYTHLYGLYSIELALVAGATICMLDLFSPPGFIEVLRTLNPTMLFAGPAHISPCLQTGLFDGLDLGALRIAVLSGSTVPESVSAAFEQKLPYGKVLQAWGMTELQFGACSRAGDDRDIRFRTIGRATPGTELRVSNPERRVLRAGEVGELEVRGCSLFSGYAGNPEATAAAFTADGWFRTGDLARIDAAGNVELKGRTKELINRGGIKFNPIDMEVALANHPAIEQVAIAPVPDDILGERAWCFVILKENGSFSFDGLRQFLSERRFAKFTWPENLIVVQDMPMTPTRKVIKSELVRRYLAERAALGSVAQ